MTLDQQIAQAITNCENYMFTLADKYLYQITLGEQPCDDIKLFVLGQWMFILKEYRIYNFDDSGSDITPVWKCVTEDEIIELIGKINALTC